MIGEGLQTAYYRGSDNRPLGDIREATTTSARSELRAEVFRRRPGESSSQIPRWSQLAGDARLRGTTLVAYTRIAYDALVAFVELTPFVAFRSEYWTDEDPRALQSFLLESPGSGDLRGGGSGLRKLRWSAQRARQTGWCQGDLLLARSEAPCLLDLRLREERARRLDAAANQSPCGIDEGCEGWINSISSNWSKVCVR